MLIDNCDIVLSCAATVNFDEHIQDALSINYFGAKRMMELSREMKHCEVFNQISTCYVNIIQTNGEVKEEIYEMNEDVEAKA